MSDFNSVLYQILGRKIKERREELKYSQDDLSKKIKSISRTSISNIEKGRQQTPLHVIYLMCNALDIDIQTILPVFSEIEAQIKSKESNLSSEIEKYINAFEADQSVLNEIKAFIKKQGNDTQL
jgi:transcriptional regulator with XRE-family HTH domain